MRAACIGALLYASLIAGCGTRPAPPSEPQPAAPQAQPGAGMPAAPPVALPSAPPVAPAPSAQAPVAATAPPIAAVPETRPTVPETLAPAPQAAAKAAAPAAKAPPTTAAPPATVSPPAKKEPPAAAQEAPLDLESLETRLKETKAIGVMTKLSLKNQVDDLLNQFRDFYAGKLKTTLADLRRPFDLLILKVLSLLQDSDPSLASAIASSREAIWGILSDRAKFAKLAAN